MRNSLIEPISVDPLKQRPAEQAERVVQAAQGRHRPPAPLFSTGSEVTLVPL